MMITKIAVLRANALGDFIFVLPALQALREAYPDSEIVLLGKELHKRLLENRPSPVDRVVVIPPYPGVGEKVTFQPDRELLDEFFTRMQDEAFDLAFQMHGGGEYSNAFVKRLGAKRTVGSRAPGAPPLDISIPYATYFSEILRYIELVGCVGVRPHILQPRISVTELDVRNAEALLHNPSGKPIALIQPGASDPRRWWPVEKFARVASELTSMGYLVCFNGVDSERMLVRRIIDCVDQKNSLMDFSGTMSLSALIGLLARTSIMISNDTGPLHLAFAIGTPAIGLYWAPNMITGTPVSLEHVRTLIAWNTNCPLCDAPFRRQEKNGCTHTVSFIDEISVEEVMSAVKELSDEKIKMAMEVAYI